MCKNKKFTFTIKMPKKTQQILTVRVVNLFFNVYVMIWDFFLFFSSVKQKGKNVHGNPEYYLLFLGKIIIKLEKKRVVNLTNIIQLT